MAELGARVVVTFYENFREVEVDIHFVGAGAEFGNEMRTFAVHEVIEENKGPNPEDPEHDIFEVVEVKDYTEEREVFFVKSVAHVEASSGTWNLEFIKFESGEGVISSSPISYLFDASAIRAAISIEDIGVDPGTLHLFRRSLRTEFGDTPVSEDPGDGTFASFTDRPDLGPNTVEMRFYFGSGLLAPRVGASIKTNDIDLGPVWVLRPEWDEISYGIPLEENLNCNGGGLPVDVPRGSARASGARSGRVLKRTRRVGASVRPRA